MYGKPLFFWLKFKDLRHKKFDVYNGGRLLSKFLRFIFKNIKIIIKDYFVLSNKI
jgi:hypothetical protein